MFKSPPDSGLALADREEAEDDAEEVVVEAAPLLKSPWGIGFWLAITWMILIVGLCALAPWLPFVDEPGALPDFSVEPAVGPSVDHWFGVNDNGIDLFSQVVNGGRVSLLIASAVVMIGFVTGGVVGMIAGFFRGRTDRIISAVVDILLAFPALILAMAMVTIFASDGNAVHPDLPVIIGSLSILAIAPLARITRGVTLKHSQREFVTAARTLGARNSRILRREILPNVVPPMAAFSLTVIAVVIVAEGALAFLGLSVSSPAPTWGKLISSGRLEIERSAHLVLFPAGVMFFTILSLNYIGDVAQTRFAVREGAL